MTAIEDRTCARCGRTFAPDQLLRVQCFDCHPRGKRPAPPPPEPRREVPLRRTTMRGWMPESGSASLGGISYGDPHQGRSRPPTGNGPVLTKRDDRLDELVVGDPYQGGDEVRLTQSRLRADVMDAANECPHGRLPHEGCVQCERPLRAVPDPPPSLGGTERKAA